MEIVHVVLGKVNTNKMNGVIQVVDLLAKNQTQLGHNVTIWGITKNPVHNYPNRNYHTVLFKDRGKLIPAKGIKKELRHVKKDTVFHFHGGFIAQFLYVSQLVHHRGFKYFLTAHGSYNTVAMQRSYWKKRVFLKWVDGLIVKNASCLHFIGDSEVEGAKSVLPVKKYVLVPNGQDLVTTSIRNDLKAEHEITFGFCGRLDMITKGLDLLFKGIAHFVTKHPNQKVSFKMIGDGTDRIKLEELSESLKLTPYVMFLGSQFGDEKLHTIKQCHFMMLTSRNEGMPMVLLEAAASALPSIVSIPTNMGRYVEKYKSGVVLPQNSPEEICKALEQCISIVQNGEYHVYQQGAINMIKREFIWSDIAQKLVNMYAQG
jgi:glycosyltransferase involved in cell wall biosynthesis